MKYSLKEKYAKLAGKLSGLKRFKPPALWCWRLALIALLLLLGSLIAVLWFSGATDTRSAWMEGRRLLVTIENGQIEGKQITLEKPPETPPAAPAEAPPAAAPAETPASPAATPESTAPAAATESAPATAPEPEVVAAIAETDKPVLPLDLGDASAVTPSAVPPVAIKESLSEKTATGVVPVMGAGDEKPWRYYAKPYKRKDSKPIVAIILADVGQSKIATNAAIKLPENIALSFNPYAKDVTSWANAARVAGHEIMVDLPLEPSNYPAADPGPYGLVVGRGAHENASRLQWLMSRFQGYIGLTVPQNEIFTVDNDSFTMLLQSLGKRGLLLAMGHEPPKTDTKQMLDTTTTAHIMVDVELDEDLNAGSIQARFAALEKKASKNGAAIGMIQAYPISIVQLGLWMDKLDKDGYTLVPVSFIAGLKNK